ncbi:MAG TPA: hypothetical protein VHO90_22445, partial [Bacteroidales bacterium]|nr:hypothetical protein [Bacteroidales bacterium]
AQGQDYLASSIYRAFRDYRNTIENRTVYAMKNEDSPRGKQDSLTESVEEPVVTPPVVKSEQPVQENKASNPAGYFMVQISSSLKPIPLNSKLFKGVKNITEYKVAERYKYTVGQKSSFKEVVDYLSDVRKNFPDAFVVGCIDGKIVPAKEVLNQNKALN